MLFFLFWIFQPQHPTSSIFHFTVLIISPSFNITISEMLFGTTEDAITLAVLRKDTKLCEISLLYSFIFWSVTSVYTEGHKLMTMFCMLHAVSHKDVGNYFTFIKNETNYHLKKRSFEEFFSSLVHKKRSNPYIQEDILQFLTLYSKMSYRYF